MSGNASPSNGFVPPPPGEFLGHPKALWNLFGTEFWERFMYYGMRAMLAVHVATAFFAHLGEGSRAEASLTYGGFTSAGPNDDVFNWQFGAPRTYGVRLAVDF